MLVRQTESTRPWLALGLVLLGVISRLVPHPWNATPVMAIALFSGTYLPRRWGLCVPLAIVAATDVILGWHDTVPYTWGAFLLTGMLGWWVRRRIGAGRVMTGSLAGSILFFLVTNLGVWLAGKLYAVTPGGLWACYVAAIPFFRATLLGDLVFAGALFGGYALASGARHAGQPAPSR